MGTQQDMLPQHPSRSSSCTPGLRTEMTFPRDLALLTSLTYPRRSTSSAAAPSEPRHLSILLPDRSESSAPCWLSQSPPRCLWGKPPSCRSCQEAWCLSPASGWEGGMGMCSRPRAVSTGCSQRPAPPEFTPTAPCAVTRIPGSRILLPAPPALGAAGSGNTAAVDPKALSWFLGARGTRTPGTALAGEEEGSRLQSQGNRGKKGCFPGCSQAPAIKLQNSRLGWGGPA